MTKVIGIFICVLLTSAFSFGQVYKTYSANTLPTELYNGLYSEIDDILSACCQKFNGTYKWGKMTMRTITEMSSSNIKVEGLVSYKGRSCGDVTCEYYVVFNAKQVFHPNGVCTLLTALWRWKYLKNGIVNVMNIIQRSRK